MTRRLALHIAGYASRSSYRSLSTELLISVAVLELSQPHTMASVSDKQLHWQEQIADKRKRQQAAIPKEWLIPPVPEGQTNVIDVPRTCGLLTERELEITGVSDVNVLLQKLATAEWSAVEVTTAFSKRAIIAHQLVRYTSSNQRRCHIDTSRPLGQLLDRDIHRQGPRASGRARCILEGTWESDGSSPWTPNFAEGPDQDQGSRDHDGQVALLFWRTRANTLRQGTQPGSGSMPRRTLSSSSYSTKRAQSCTFARTCPRH